MIVQYDAISQEGANHQNNINMDCSLQSATWKRNCE